MNWEMIYQGVGSTSLFLMWCFNKGLLWFAVPMSILVFILQIPKGGKD